MVDDLVFLFRAHHGTVVRIRCLTSVPHTLPPYFIIARSFLKFFDDLFFEVFCSLIFINMKYVVTIFVTTRTTKVLIDSTNHADHEHRFAGSHFWDTFWDSWDRKELYRYITSVAAFQPQPTDAFTLQ
jgi:hypothetical protein